MSIKTPKRVVLTVIASLVLAPLTAVSPASASTVPAANITAVTIADAAVGRVGSALATAVSFTSTGTTAGHDIRLAGVLTSKPAGSTATVIFDGTGLALAGPTNETTAFTAATGFQPAFLLSDGGSTTAMTNATHVAGRVGIIPDVVGDYGITVWHDADADGAIDPDESRGTSTFTVGAAPTSATMTAQNSNFCATTANGALVKVTLPASTGLALGEAIRITPSTATADITKVNNAGVTYTTGTTTYIDLVDSNFVNGVAWVNVTDTATGTNSLTLTLAGQGTSVAAITGTISLSGRTCDATGTGTTVIQGATAGAAFTSITDGINGTSTTATIPLAAKTLTYFTSWTEGATAATYFGATVTDDSGRVTGSASQGLTGLLYDVAYLNAANATTATTIEGSFGVTITPSALNDAFTVATIGGTTLTSTVTVNGVVSSAGTTTVSPSAALSLKTGSSITYAVTHKDKFGRAIPNASVKMVITGRNANQTVTPPTAVTDANGVASFTLTDAPAAGTTSLSDSIVFTAYGADGTSKAATAVTITWSATGPVVGTVTILGGNNGTTTGVAMTTPQYKDIAAGTAGAAAGIVTATATVKDASGNLLAGVPVTFTISGTTAAVTSTTQTVYTGAAGTAVANVYAWIEGSYTVTATAGGVSGTAVYQFRQSGAGEERKISASVSGSVVTAKVVDRFGNPVPSVTVYATKTGTGYFGTGVLRTSGTTDNLGEVSFVVTGGGAVVTVATYDAATATAPLGSGQTCAAAGKSNCATAATSFTATTVGTATTAETGVGASFADAGVASATATVTDAAGNAAQAAGNAATTAAEAATDAAAEAIDAANAATDAANLAAEAADAATVAAEEARDAADAATAAVEELATQVATLMAALKAQITTLANTVAKIAKKVKA